MKQSRQFGMVAAGPVSKSYLPRLPGFLDGLGPVYAEPHRVASRMVNSLRAGNPVAQLEDAAAPDCLVIATWEPAVAEMVRRLAVSEVNWEGKTVILCSDYLSSEELSPLAALGAGTASLCPLPGFDGGRLVVEGCAAAIREIRRLFEHGQVRIVELRRGAKATYLAGLTFATSLFTPLIEAAAQSFRESGLPPMMATQALERIFHESLRKYLHARRKSWSGPLARNHLDLVQEQMEALARTSPALAAYFQDSAEHSLKLLQNSVELSVTPEDPDVLSV